MRSRPSRSACSFSFSSPRYWRACSTPDAFGLVAMASCGDGICRDVLRVGPDVRNGSAASDRPGYGERAVLHWFRNQHCSGADCLCRRANCCLVLQRSARHWPDHRDVSLISAGRARFATYCTLAPLDALDDPAMDRSGGTCGGWAGRDSGRVEDRSRLLVARGYNARCTNRHVVTDMDGMSLAAKLGCGLARGS